MSLKWHSLFRRQRIHILSNCIRCIVDFPTHGALKRATKTSTVILQIHDSSIPNGPFMNPDKDRIPIQKLQGHHCFACGTDNPIGLNMQFYRMGDMVCSDITLKKDHEGWENMAHGGIASTLLDEVMSWTVLYFKRTFMVTRKMSMKYIKPIPLGVPLTARGKIMDESSPPKIIIRGDIVDAQKKLLARSTGEFVMLAENQLSSVSQGLKQEMMDMMAQFKKATP